MNEEHVSKILNNLLQNADLLKYPQFFDPFEHIVAVHIETIHLICTAN